MFLMLSVSPKSMQTFWNDPYTLGDSTFEHKRQEQSDFIPHKFIFHNKYCSWGWQFRDQSSSFTEILSKTFTQALFAQCHDLNCSSKNKLSIKYGMVKNGPDLLSPLFYFGWLSTEFVFLMTCTVSTSIVFFVPFSLWKYIIWNMIWTNASWMLIEKDIPDILAY